MWLSLKKARIIARDLERAFFLRAVDEDVLIEAMWSHPLFEDHMWLDIHWTIHNKVAGVHVGIEGGIIL